VFDQLLPFYERELGTLRELAGEFAGRYPKIARRLQIDGEQCGDPQVERLFETFAFLAARIHRRLDDEVPEITEAFIQVLYPHYARPIPSATILQLLLDPDKPAIAGRYPVPRHQPVSAQVEETECLFRTCFGVDLWPVTLTGARMELNENSTDLRRFAPGAAVVTLDLAADGNLTFAGLKLDRLRFFLDGPPSEMSLLYQLLFSRLKGIRVTDGGDDPAHAVLLPREALRPVGFEPDEGLLESEPRALTGYRLLSEYFAFPDKFMFFELTGLDHARLRHDGNKLRIQLILSQYGRSERHASLLQNLSAQHFKLGCVPVVNLFPAAGDPIRLIDRQSSYPVHVNGCELDACEVYSIDSVARMEKAGTREAGAEVPPFYSVRHFAAEGEHPFHWYATREPSPRKHDRGTDVALALVDLEFRPARPEAGLLSLQLTCSNRDLPERIPFGSASAPDAFTVANHAVIKRVVTLRKPSPSLRPPAKRGHQWRLVSHLSLNHLALLSQGKGPLQEVLGLYDYADSSTVQRQIKGMVAIATKAVTGRMPGEEFASFARGLEVAFTFDETFYVGSNLYLFTSLLERFLAQFCPATSFVKVRLFTTQQAGEVAQWPSRAGTAAML
jgi:type VI secretion system protein ImpG